MTKREFKKELGVITEKRIEKKILNSLFNNLDNYNGTTKEKLNDCLVDWMHGCSSGIISDVIYYHDTKKIFDYYKKEIMELINNYISLGYFEIYNDIKAFNIEGVTFLLNSNNELEEKTFDIYQKNTLVWFVYDVTIHNLYNKFSELKD